MPTPPIGGTTHPQFEALRPMFSDLWRSIEVGAAVAIYWRGECVVNLWGGYTDRDRSQAWQADTLVNTYSITKGVVATALAKLVALGQLDYQSPVVHYWPEFGAQGKERITVRELLSHQAGLCGVSTKLTVDDLYDWRTIINLLEKQAPLWPPGSQSGYHAITWGYLAGELIQRITGMTPGTFIATEICAPLGLNFYLGVPEDSLPSCAEIIGPNHARLDQPQENRQPNKRVSPDSKPNNPLFEIAQTNPIISPFKHASSNPWRRAEIPASNGHSNGLSLARLYGVLANQGEIDGHQFLSTDAIAAAREVAVDNQLDAVMGHVIRRSQGGFILSHGGNYGPGKMSFGHAGAGGSMAFADPEANLGFAYVMNQLQPEGFRPRYEKMISKVYELVEKLG